MDDKKETTATEDDGVQPQAGTIVDKANSAAERLEKANEKAEEIAGRIEDAAAKNMLAGRAEAGITPVKKTEDEKWAEDAKERYAGTGMSPVEDEDGE